MEEKVAVKMAALIHLDIFDRREKNKPASRPNMAREYLVVGEKMGKKSVEKKMYFFSDMQTNEMALSKMVFQVYQKL